MSCSAHEKSLRKQRCRRREGQVRASSSGWARTSQGTTSPKEQRSSTCWWWPVPAASPSSPRPWERPPPPIQGPFLGGGDFPGPSACRTPPSSVFLKCVRFPWGSSRAAERRRAFSSQKGGSSDGSSDPTTLLASSSCPPGARRLTSPPPGGACPQAGLHYRESVRPEEPSPGKPTPVTHPLGHPAARPAGGWGHGENVSCNWFRGHTCGPTC